MQTLLSAIVMGYLFAPVIASIGIKSVHYEPLQSFLFVLGYVTLLFHPYHKLQVKVNDCTFEGYASSSCLIKCLYLNGKYERSLTKFMYQYLSKFNILIDIGANEGYFTTLMAKVCKKVIAIEPAKANVDIMKRNLEINNIKNVNIHQVAAGDKNGSIVFNECVINGMWNNVGEKRYPIGMKSYKVPVKRIYELINPKDLPFIKLIKMDVEGFEMQAILGLEELFINTNIIWIVETKDWKIVKFFKDRGFFCYSLLVDSISFPQIIHNPQTLKLRRVEHLYNCIFTKIAL